MPKSRFGRDASVVTCTITAGGMPLLAITASNIHLSSRRRREACKPDRKSKRPYDKMWVQIDTPRTKQGIDDVLFSLRLLPLRKAHP